METSVSIPIALLAGILSFASPCFLPVVPVFVGYMVGTPEAPRATTTTTATRLSAVKHAVAFVGAFSLVFTLLWTLVGLVGWVVGDYRDILRIGGGVILILLGLHTAQLIRIPLLDRTLKVAYSPEMAEPPTYRRSFLLGLAFGAGWTPCIGPVLGGILGLATTAGSVSSGFGLLIVYSLGLGIPFVLVCAGITSVSRRMSWFTKHHRGINIATGVMLICIGFLMITNLFSHLASMTSVIL